MKKLVFVMLFLIALSSFSFTALAGWIYSDKAKKWYYLDDQTKELIRGKWHGIIDNNTNEIKYYFFNENGCLLMNTITPDGKQVNEKGEWVENGIVKVIIPNSKPSSNVINASGQELTDKHKEKVEEVSNKQTVNDNSNILYAQQGESSGRLLKNYILASENVEIIDEKNINGSKKRNVITFKNDGAFISINTKKYNKIIIKMERDKSSRDDYFRLALIVNGDEQDSIEFEDEEYITEYEFTYSLNDDVDIVMYSNAENNSWSSKNVYITSGRMSKYNEDEE